MIQLRQVVVRINRNDTQGAKRNDLPYTLGLGALTGGIISSIYLVLVSPVLAAGIIPLSIVIGLILVFIGATAINTIVMAIILTLGTGATTGLSDYASGAVIGTVITYATVVFYFFSLV